jgi:hypothetical protein
MDVLRQNTLAGPRDTVSAVPGVQNVKVSMEAQHAIACHHSLRDSFALYEYMT